MEHPLPPSGEAFESASSTSLISRLTGVFATPGDVFEGLRACEPKTSNWLVPVLLSCVVGVLYVVVVFSQPAVQQQMKEIGEKRIDKMVEQGKLSADAAKQAQESAERFTMVAAKVGGAISAVAGNFIWVFLLGFILERLARWALKSPIAYLRALEVAGLAGMIGCLGGLLTMLLVVNTGSLFTTPSAALLLKEYNPGNRLHVLLSLLNVATLWYAVVLAIGLGKVCGRSGLIAGAWLFGLWLPLRIGFLFSPWGTGGM